MAPPLLRLCGCMGILVAACAPAPVEIELMPTPGVFADGAADPFADPASLEGLPKLDLLYATLRSPALDEDPERFYTNDRGYVLRAGVARVEGGEGDLSVAEVRRLSLEEGRSEAFDLKVTSVQELGVIDASVFAPPEVQAGEEDARARFAVDVETRLSRGPSSDVFVYVHGYKVVFENPVLVASELWHFLGYQGAMVAFSWPSTPSALAYFSDLETAALAARGLRRLIEIMSAIPEVERIHVLGYSAGTRVVIEMLDDLALIHRDRNASGSRSGKLGRVVLVGSDVDRETMGASLDDGVLDVLESLTIYQSTEDKALGMSRRSLGGRTRVGEVVDENQQRSETEAFLEKHDGRLNLIDVTDADRYRESNGHRYFLRSPWVAGDVLLLLGAGMVPDDRGLERQQGSVVWSFPPDYLDRLPEIRQRLVALWTSR